MLLSTTSFTQAALLLTGYLSSDYHRAILNLAGALVRYCTTAITPWLSSAKPATRETVKASEVSTWKLHFWERLSSSVAQSSTPFKQNCRKYERQRCCRCHWTGVRFGRGETQKVQFAFSPSCPGTAARRRRSWHGTSTPQMKEKMHFAQCNFFGDYGIQIKQFLVICEACGLDQCCGICN